MRFGVRETAKRSRLERIVRPLKPMLLVEQPGCKIGLKRVNLQPGGGITGLSYAGAPGGSISVGSQIIPAKKFQKSSVL